MNKFILLFQFIFICSLTIAQNTSKEGSIFIQVENYPETMATINKLLSKQNGFIYEEKETRTGNKIENDIIVRIPTAYFDSFLNEIINISIKIQNKKVQVIDHQQQIAYINERIKAKELVKERYNDLISKSKSDIAIDEAKNKLEKVNKEIDIETRNLRMLDKQELSTLFLNIQQISKSTQKGVNVNQRDNLDLSAQNMLRMFKISIYFIVPILLLIIFGYFWFKKNYTKKRPRRKNSKTSSSKSNTPNADW